MVAISTLFPPPGPDMTRRAGNGSVALACIHCEYSGRSNIHSQVSAKRLVYSSSRSASWKSLPYPASRGGPKSVDISPTRALWNIVLTPSYFLRSASCFDEVVVALKRFYQPIGWNTHISYRQWKHSSKSCIRIVRINRGRYTNLYAARIDLVSSLGYALPQHLPETSVSSPRNHVSSLTTPHLGSTKWIEDTETFCAASSDFRYR